MMCLNPDSERGQFCRTKAHAAIGFLSFEALFLTVHNLSLE